MYVVAVGMKKVYKALIRLTRGAFSIPLLMSISEAFSASFLTLIKLCYWKALEWSSLVPGPEAKSSSLEITNPTSFTISYQYEEVFYLGSQICFFFFLLMKKTNKTFLCAMCGHIGDIQFHPNSLIHIPRTPLKVYSTSLSL